MKGTLCLFGGCGRMWFKYCVLTESEGLWFRNLVTAVRGCFNSVLMLFFLLRLVVEWGDRDWNNMLFWKFKKKKTTFWGWVEDEFEAIIMKEKNIWKRIGQMLKKVCGSWVCLIETYLQVSEHGNIATRWRIECAVCKCARQRITRPDTQQYSRGRTDHNFRNILDRPTDRPTNGLKKRGVKTHSALLKRIRITK